MSDPPNVLLVVLDAARRDALTPYGAPAEATPTLAALAARGTAVAQAYTTAPWTVPAHTSLFTGRIASELGLDQIQDGNPRMVIEALASVSDELLPSVLGRAATAARGSARTSGSPQIPASTPALTSTATSLPSGCCRWSLDGAQR